LRLTLASVLAMGAAAFFAVANPWWAAMAVWMVSQPTRGMLLERTLAQLIGALAGCLAGVLIRQLGSPPFEIAALAAWLGLCSGLAALMRHQRAYGAALGGLTGAIVVISTISTTIDIATFAGARLLDTAIGVFASLGILAIWQPKSAFEGVTEAATRAGSDALRLAADFLDDSMHEHDHDHRALEKRVFFDIAVVEAGAEDAAAGSPGARRAIRPMRAFLHSLLELLAAGKTLSILMMRASAEERAQLHALAEDLRQLAAGLAHGGETPDLPAVVDTCRALAGSGSALLAPLDDIARCIEHAHGDMKAMRSRRLGPARGTLLDAPDFTGAGWAALRGIIGGLVVGAAWLVMQAEILRFLMLGTCIFTVLLAAADEPVEILKNIFVGGMMASVAAVLWHWQVAPELGGGYLGLLLATPLFLVAALWQVTRRTLFVGLALNMLFAVLAQPVGTLPHGAATTALAGAMLLCGIAFSYILYRWILPMSGHHRAAALKTRIRREMVSIARAGDARIRRRHFARLRSLVLASIMKSAADPVASDRLIALVSVGYLMTFSKEVAYPDRSFGAALLSARRRLRLGITPVSPR
jgi:uncharacterized membrane protein YccC